MLPNFGKWEKIYDTTFDTYFVKVQTLNNDKTLEFMYFFSTPYEDVK